MGGLRKIAEYGKLLHDDKLVIGSGGNISELDGEFLIIKKKGTDMSSGRTGGYIRLPLLAAEKGGDGRLSSETPFHIACYMARTDIGAVIHVHSPYMVASAGKTDILESVSYEFDCILKKAVPVVEYIRPGSPELAGEIAAKIKAGANAVLLRRHGGLSAGKDLEEAYLRILALERACITFLHSR
ncbi:MAG: class II aldolase/adducin family protein [Candidatus Omnitrophota bacterium]